MSWKVVPRPRTYNSKSSVFVAAVGLSDDIIMSLNWLQNPGFCSKSSIFCAQYLPFTAKQLQILTWEY